METQTISPVQLRALYDAGTTIDLIDVRTPLEFREAHISFARSIPLEALDAEGIRRSRSDSAQPLYVICQSGVRGRKACEFLLKAGVCNILNVEGGTVAGIAAGLPITRGRKAVSLERQVRIAAGSLVVLGCLLGWLVHPIFYCLSAFIGAGLIFAGVTDTCGMGMLLARMPWNQCNGDTSGCPT